jgi:RHS repeat-associated protein
MATWFGCDPDLAASSSSQLAEITGQIDPVGQWLGDVDAAGVDDVAGALGELADKASSLTDDLTTRVGSASELLGSLASGTHDVDASLLERLELVSAEPGQPQPTVPPTGGGGEDLDGAGTGSGASRNPSQVVTGGDPVDVATGDVVFAQTDVSLPGLLPLVLERSHRSSWRTGRWFGRSWMSSLDQRLLVTADRVLGAFADGRVLTWTYPNGSGGSPVLPVTGDAWPLVRNADGSCTVSDPQRGLTWQFKSRPGDDTRAGNQGELPLVSVTDRVGHEIVFSYDPAGQPVSVSHSGGYRVRVIVTDGRVTGLELSGRDGSGDVPLMSYQYDADGNLAGVINSSGQPFQFSYDDAGRLAGWRDRNGHSYRYAYDAQGRCVRGEGPGGALSGTFSYQPGVTRWTDAAGAVTSYEATGAALIASVTDPLGSVTRWEHDESGRTIKRTDALGRVTRYAHDDRGNLITITRPDGLQVTAEYNEQCQPLRLTGPDGSVWRQEVDSRGNRTRLIAPDGTVRRFAYDNRGHLAGVTGPDGSATRVTCNAAGLPVEVISPNDAHTHYSRDRFGGVTSVTGPGGESTTLTWTVEGRPATRTFPDGAVQSWSWDAEGNLTRHSNPAGAATRYEYGPFDKATAMIWPDGTRSEFRYDHRLRLTRVGHGGLTWGYEYDLAGRLVAGTSYNGTATRYAYDAAGQLISRANGAGQEVAFGYDLLGNLTGSSADGALATFGYDRAGRLVHARNPDAEVRLERDPLGRVTAETCNGRAVRAEYDAAGRVTRRITPSGAVTSWEFDRSGLPTAMTASEHQVRFGYDAVGQEILRELPGGLTFTQDWDTRGRLIVQALAGPGQPATAGPEGAPVPGPLLQRRAYTYRADGFPERIDDLLAGTRAINLDPSGRVTAVTGPDWVEQYGYDHAGNVTAATFAAPPSDSGATWPDAGPQGSRHFVGTHVTQVGNIRYRHDLAGRVITRQRVRISRKPESWQYQWDGNDRLTAVTTPDGATWRYKYDPFGRRTAKQHLTPDGQVAEETSFTWDGPLLIEQAQTAGSRAHVTTWDYQPGTFRPIAQAEREFLRDAPQPEIDQRFYAIIADLIGNPSELTAPDGTLASHQQRTLWGSTLWRGSAPTPLRFPGQYFDPETGLHYNCQRYYDPVSGSYLSPDPLGLAPAPNPHAYVGNPLVLSDPLGLKGAPGEDDWTTAYRFHDAADPNTLLPALNSADPATQAKVLNDLQDPVLRRFMADSQMGGGTAESPFVSLTTDPAGAASTTDGWLRTIATGQPGHQNAELAPNLSEFRVPTSRLIYPQPTNTLSRSEGEVLWQGNDLGQYLVKTVPNPYALPPPVP